ncbi:hypothetical protein ON010_g2648 [Phytophthora cinnamomi]|nr:hypothetical protein ON010_g2648 [Phytophthora cinnamomi]
MTAVKIATSYIPHSQFNLPRSSSTSNDQTATQRHAASDQWCGCFHARSKRRELGRTRPGVARGGGRGCDAAEAGSDAKLTSGRMTEPSVIVATRSGSRANMNVENEERRQQSHKLQQEEHSKVDGVAAARGTGSAVERRPGRNVQEVGRDQSDERRQEKVLERDSDERTRDVDEPIGHPKTPRAPPRAQKSTHFLLEAPDHARQHSAEDPTAQEIGQHEAQRGARRGAKRDQNLGLQKWVHGSGQNAQHDGPRDGEGLQRDVHDAEAAEHEGGVVLAVLAGALPEALDGAHFVVAPI